MTKIVPTELEQTIVDEITLDRKGHGYITARGTARLLGINHQSITGNRFPKKLAESFTQQGIDPGKLPFGEVALTLIAEYYAYHAQKTTEQARRVYRTLAAIGARAWMQQLKGWNQLEQPTPQLPPGDVRVANLMEACKFFDLDVNNPRFKQHIQDLTGDILGLTPYQKTLPELEARWCGVVERAEELGHPLAKVTKYRSQMGSMSSSTTEEKSDKRKDYVMGHSDSLISTKCRMNWMYA